MAQWNLGGPGMARGMKRLPIPVLVFGFMSMAAPELYVGPGFLGRVRVRAGSRLKLTKFRA